MGEYTVENVLHAIHSMYNNPHQQTYKEIDNWLKGYQKSSQAWTVIGSIFSLPNQHETSYLFNAQTFKTKLMFDFEELKGLDLVSFKNNLLSLCLKFSDQYKIMRQLAQCVGILSIHIVEIWGDSMLNEIFAVFSGKTLLILETLRSIAEEINNQSIVVDSDNICSLYKTLENQSSGIFSFLESCSEEFSVYVLEVFLVWVQFGTNKETFVIQPQSKILLLSFEALKIEEKFETACGILCEIINLTENYEKYGETAKVIVAGLMQMKDDARRSLEDNTKAEGYIKIYSVFATAHFRTMLAEKSIDLIEFLIELFATDSNNGIYELTQFFHRFSRHYKRLEQNSELREVYSYIMQKLLSFCVKHFKLGSSELLAGTEKETSDKRYNVSVVLQDIVDILGQEYVLGLFVRDLGEILGKLDRNDYETMSRIEALAGCMVAISEIATASSELTLLYAHLCSEVWPVVQINVSVCLIFESYRAPLPENLLPTVISYLVHCLQVKTPSKSVANAVKHICFTNFSHLLNYVPSLLQLHSISLEIAPESQSSVLEGIANVVWRTSETESITKLCDVYSCELTETVTVEKLLFNCDKIAVIFKASAEKEIRTVFVHSLFKKIWPQLQRLVELFQTNDEAVEDICRIVKHAIKKLGLLFGEFVSGFAHIISNQFLMYKHSSYLYMAEQVVKIFGNSSVYQEDLIQLFNILTTASLAELNSFQSLTEKPELTEDFFGMCIRYLIYCSEKVMASQNFERILKLAQIGIGLQHQEASKCLYGFLETVLEYCANENGSSGFAANMLMGYFQVVLDSLFAAILSGIYKNIYEHVEELCCKIILMRDGATWLAKSLAQVPYDCLTVAEKNKFVAETQEEDKHYNVRMWLEKLYKRSKRRALRLR